MTPAQSRALRRFELAVREHEFKGGRPDNDHDEIQKEYERAKAALVRQLEKVPTCH